MEHKSDSDDAGVHGDIVWGEDDVDAAFDDAVTSEITAINVVRIKGDDVRAPAVADAAPASDQAEAEPSTVDDDALPPGLLLSDRYEIVSLVHSGGMGQVYKAIDHRRHVGGSEQRHVAIKTIRRSIAARLDANLALEREAAKTRLLAHPNIVNVFDFDQHGDQFYLVMEWLHGESLNALLRRTSGQRLEPQFAWRIVEGIAAGLQHAHANNVVHADINPSNVFITETQEIKLLDFGVARFATDPANEAQDATVWATRTYASPEVLSGLTPGFEDDIFSLGCVAYRLMSGAHPFSGLSSADAISVEAEVPRIAGLSEAHWQTLSRALSFARTDRPSSASDFIADVTTAPEADLSWDLFSRSPVRWWPVIAVAAGVVAGAWWLTQDRIAPQAPAAGGAASVDGGTAPSPEAAARSAEIERLLSDAARAADETRLVVPAGENARDLYRDVLALEPANERALRGLRAISDVYVQQATSSLRDGDVEVAMGALALAMETSPDNPSIAVLNELIAAQGDGQLANARLAAAAGDTDRALEILAEAERYGAIDTAAANALREQVSQTIEEQQFLATLASADGHLSAGRLIAPANNNAQALLLGLKEQRANDPRLNASLQRLGERQLTRAAFAVAAGNFDEASRMLAAAEALGVLQNDVAASQRSLQQARRMQSAAAARPAPARAEPGSSATVAARPQPTGAAAAAPPIAADAGQPSAPATTDGAAADDAAAAGSADIDATPPPRKITLAELAIEKYVAPGFPRSARRRGLEGFVNVRFSVNPDGSTSDIETLRAEPGKIFAASAEKAISQWRFAPRDDIVTTQVTLNFLLEP